MTEYDTIQSYQEREEDRNEIHRQTAFRNQINVLMPTPTTARIQATKD